MRRLLIAASAVTALCVATSTSTAQAGFFTGQPIDDARSVGDVDLALDGTGGVTYLKRVGGVDHVFVSRFVGGVFQAPERIDGAFAGSSSNPTLAAAPDGRLLVAFSNGGFVHGVVRPAGKGYFGPTGLGDGHHPSADMSVHGGGVVSFTSNGKDVRVARLDRKSNRWTTLPAVADIVQGHAAGGGSGRSKVAISADNVGIVTWGESGHVYARKIFGGGFSSAPQDLTPPSVGGKASTLSELPDIDAEEDSSYAWVVFRQSVAGGNGRILARRQRGTQFDGPVGVDVGSEPATAPRIDLDPRGVGIAVSATTITRQPMAAVIGNRDVFGGPGRIFFGSSVPSTPTVAMSDNDDGLVAAVIGGVTPVVRVRPYVAGVPQAELNLSNSQLGAVAAGMGLEAAGDRRSGFVVAWIQGGKVVAGYADEEPADFGGSSKTKCCVAGRANLKWRQASNLWGAVRYEVYVDGKLAGATTRTNLKLAKSLRGIRHKWYVIAKDIRGQLKATATRKLVVDDLRPRQKVRYRRKGRNVRLVVLGGDRRRAGHRTSGISGTAVTWGDKRKSSRRGARARLGHRYRRSGTFTIRIRTRDKAGNETLRIRRVRVG